MTGLSWNPTSTLKNWRPDRLENIRKLIIQTTGESYQTSRLRNLPLDEKFGLWTLTDGLTDYGLLWAMKMSESRARVLAFSVAENLQGNGYGSKGWFHFARAAQSLGIRSVQLEVRQDNFEAVQMYHRRGLRPKGFLRGFYRGYDGWLMMGPLHQNASSQ